jgi:hypothetical protein
VGFSFVHVVTVEDNVKIELKTEIMSDINCFKVFVIGNKCALHNLLGQA